MSEHKVELDWKLETEDFDIKKYNREHTITFKNGQKIQASAATAYLGKADFIDPEEAFIGSFASCHMLTFLAVASKRGFKISSYEDTAIGVLAKNEQGKMSITNVMLNPNIEFTGDKIPSDEEISDMHDKAHQECFIANSVNSKIEVKH
jgi:organic hydroperoxide reductase OsmC/OhrA